MVVASQGRIDTDSSVWPPHWRSNGQKDASTCLVRRDASACLGRADVLASFLEAGAGSGENSRFPQGVVGPAGFKVAGMSFPRCCCQATSVPRVGYPWPGA